MLDSTTKRRIDACRDILVGKVPDPKSQVEQITIALIYKFMDDMDAEAEELGGKRSFFAGEYAKYGWARLMAPNMGGFDVLALYSEAIGKMNENPGIPALFRDIFKNAYLPYRDPETLRAFLKEIDGFTYDHSERLGDAFEYLLSVLGSQGDAGQFRTPRHIIDFMVDVINPQKNESVLDPACGTAGFLISAWKHILKQNTKDRAGDQLTPTERANLVANIHGYDISPDMVRLSLVNLYLHGFTDPHIVEYDTLTSEERWNETADVILANPPFMSPKGGIKPHKRFSVQATRSEVLFVDYMAEHLSPQGRAAIVVPEGIIFQSGTAYKKLREMLVKTSLVAVVSLPAGVFNPYSGVKTSILILDKRLARSCDSVLFVKVENDGFNLGAQRRAVAGSDLPEARRLLDTFFAAPKDFENGAAALKVARAKIGENGESSLSGERYRDTGTNYMGDWPTEQLKALCSITTGKKDVNQGNHNGAYPFFTCAKKHTYSDEYSFDTEALLVAGNGDVGAVQYFSGKFEAYQRTYILHKFDERLTAKYLFAMLQQGFKQHLEKLSQGNTMPYVKLGMLAEYSIPLPPLAIQQEIVAEIEGYQKIIDGARQVVENYRPNIAIDPKWPILPFSDAPFQIVDGDRGANYPSKEDFSPAGHCLFLNTKNVRSDGFKFDELEFINEEKDNALRKGKLQRGDVLLTTRGTIGNTALYDASVEFVHVRINSGMLIFRPDATQILSSYLFHFFQSENFQVQTEATISGAAQPQLPIRSLNEARIPLPPVDVQRAIVAEIEAEQALVNANKQLIARFEAKIKATIDRVWGSSE